MLEINKDKIPRFVPRDIVNTIDNIDYDPLQNLNEDNVSPVMPLTEHDKKRLNLLNYFQEMRELENQVSEELSKLMSNLNIPIPSTG